MTERTVSQLSPAFLMVPLAAQDGSQSATLQAIYQQIYERAVLQAQQKPRLPDLFSNMN